MNTKYLAVFACILMAVMMVKPIYSVNAQRIPPVIQDPDASSPDSLFTRLLTPDSQGGVDVMGWPLTSSQYTAVLNNTGIIVEPLADAGEFEMAFNNNVTDGTHMNVRSPMNFTDFRNAMNCLIDSDGVIAGPILGGFAIRDYTQIPQPLMNAYVNPSVSGANYPWNFNVTHALQVLYIGGWYSTTVYPTFGSLLAAYGGGAGTLSSANGTTSGVIYPANDVNDQGWGITDTSTNTMTGPTAYTVEGVAGQPIQPLVGYVLSGDARVNLGDMFCNELKAIGCPYVENHEATLAALRPYVLAAQVYDFATLGYTMSSPPNWFYSELTPNGIYTNGPNPYLVQDANMTYWATKMYTDPTQTGYQVDSNNVQDILVMESELVSVYSPATYCAYKAGMLGQIDELGYGTQGNGQLMNWITLDSKKNNTIVYTGDPNATPPSNIIYYGELNTPDLLNPIFSTSLSDFQILDEIFTYPLASNPYNDIVPGSAITGVPAGGDLPWMAYSWKTELIPAEDGSAGQWTNVTLYFRHDILWQDYVPFTVADLNYTIYENALYGDSYANAAMRFMVNASANYAPYFKEWDPYTCSILVTSPSWLSLYMPNCEIIPQHLYQYIVPSNITAAEQGTATDGLHGLWPGQAASPSNVISNPYFTYARLTSDPSTTLIGTGPYKYRVGTANETSLAGITLDGCWNFTEPNSASTGFFFTPAPGAIAFKYTWLATSPSAQPSGGYFKVGLSDLVYLANAYGTAGTPPSKVPLNSTPGAAHTWNPACDLAAPSGSIGLSDLVTLALHYGWYYGNYSYNAPYPPSEIANDGP